MSSRTVSAGTSSSLREQRAAISRSPPAERAGPDNASATAGGGFPRPRPTGAPATPVSPTGARPEDCRPGSHARSSLLRHPSHPSGEQSENRSNEVSAEAALLQLAGFKSDHAERGETATRDEGGDKQEGRADHDRHGKFRSGGTHGRSWSATDRGYYGPVPRGSRAPTPLAARFRPRRPTGAQRGGSCQGSRL